jgi:P22 coat protein - gene protein 5
MANTISNIAENIQFFGTEVLVQLRNRLALVGLANRNYEGAASAPGSIINVPTIAISGAARTRTINAAVVTDDINSANVQVTMTQIYKGVKIDNLQKTFSNIDLMLEIAKRLAIVLADGADSLLTGLWWQIPYEVGKVDGTASFNATDRMNVLAQARRQLMANQSPTDQLKSVFGPTEAFNLRALDLYQQAMQAGTPEQRMSGALLPGMGFEIRESQSIPTNILLTTAAIWGTPTSTGTQPIGGTTIVFAGLGAGTLKQGSIFKHTASGFQYALAADQAIVTNAATVTVTPALKAAIANADAFSITNPITGNSFGHSATQSINVAFDPGAYLFVIRPQADFVPGSGVASFQFSDPDSNLSFRLHFESYVSGAAGTAMQEFLTADLLAGAAVVRPELATRITGQV